MGFFDSFQGADPSAGGLLNGLPASWQYPSPLDAGTGQAAPFSLAGPPPQGSPAAAVPLPMARPDQAPAAIPAPQPGAPMDISAPAPAPSLGDHIAAAVQNFRAGGQGGGLVGGFTGGASGLMSGQLSPQAVAMQQRVQAQTTNNNPAAPTNYDKQPAPFSLFPQSPKIDLSSAYANLRRG